jgi:hypothetical protein
MTLCYKCTHIIKNIMQASMGKLQASIQLSIKTIDVLLVELNRFYIKKLIFFMLLFINFFIGICHHIFQCFFNQFF